MAAIGIVASWCAIASGPRAAAAAPAPPVTPYRSPPFACDFVHFGNGVAPDPADVPQDPFCVDYDKRDITVSDGGAARFLLAEPARFAAAVPKCQYWQRDHWSIQVSGSNGAIVRWDGSYWFDKGRGAGAALLRNFTLAGQPVGAWQAAAMVEVISPEVAALIRSYGAGPTGGGGAAFSLGADDLQCPR
jgi:hypothetical protein